MTDLAMPAARRGTPEQQHDELFNATYSQYLPMVRETIRQRLGQSDRHLVDDLAQNTFLTFYRYLARLDASYDFGGLLRVMARQSISHHFRLLRNQREQPADFGHWTLADRAVAATGSGYYIPAPTGFRTATLATQPGDSDPDMDEALHRVRKGGRS
ncbi:sigma-70 family RNA polymerase sigma factor [Streptomyces sp. NPDC101249]|uniref:sigma-70 family RNA polymerase sigma factor n=1 Tax=Streptomyces sp. NPDC101249 TaxID=3366140 RepID=UPI0037F4D2DE